ncbi:hypothetical protein [Aliarcobacter butzleri]|uniref:hypothetical protein n=1 Tax=Aliarcobacter butzleri TaxID=28197 RepID=UPI0012699288|nr:hypothetical protein [Aliarcobacter butzleri]
MLDKIKIKEALGMDKDRFFNLTRSIGLENKAFYRETEFRLMLSFLEKTENFKLDEKHQIFTEIEKINKTTKKGKVA